MESRLHPSGGPGDRRDGLHREGRQIGRGPAAIQRDRRSDRELPDWCIPRLCYPTRKDIPGSRALPTPGVGPGRRPARRSGGPETDRVRDQATIGAADATTGTGGWGASSVGDRRCGLRERPALRIWPGEQKEPFVLEVACKEPLWSWQEHGPKQVRADRLTEQVPPAGWERLSAGWGAKGPQLDDWARLRLFRPDGQAGNTGCWCGWPGAAGR